MAEIFRSLIESKHPAIYCYWRVLIRVDTTWLGSETDGLRSDFRTTIAFGSDLAIGLSVFEKGQQ